MNELSQEELSRLTVDFLGRSERELAELDRMRSSYSKALRALRRHFWGIFVSGLLVGMLIGTAIAGTVCQR